MTTWNALTAAGIALIVGGLATLAGLRRTLFGGPRPRRRAAGRRAVEGPRAVAAITAAPAADRAAADAPDPAATPGDPVVPHPRRARRRRTGPPAAARRAPADEPADQRSGLVTLGLADDEDDDGYAAAADAVPATGAVPAAADDVVAGADVQVDADLAAGADVSAGDDLSAGADVSAGGPVAGPGAGVTAAGGRDRSTPDAAQRDAVRRDAAEQDAAVGVAAERAAAERAAAGWDAAWSATPRPGAGRAEAVDARPRTAGDDAPRRRGSRDGDVTGRLPDVAAAADPGRAPAAPARPVGWWGPGTAEPGDGTGDDGGRDDVTGAWRTVPAADPWAAGAGDRPAPAGREPDPAAPAGTAARPAGFTPATRTGGHAPPAPPAPNRYAAAGADTGATPSPGDPAAVAPAGTVGAADDHGWWRVSDGSAAESTGSWRVDGPAAESTGSWRVDGPAAEGTGSWRMDGPAAEGTGSWRVDGPAADGSGSRPAGAGPARDASGPAAPDTAGTGAPGRDRSGAFAFVSEPVEAHPYGDLRDEVDSRYDLQHGPEPVPGYGYRADGWVRPRYPDDDPEDGAGAYWTPDPYAEAERGYGWPTPAERAAAGQWPVHAPVPEWPPARRPAPAPAGDTRDGGPIWTAPVLPDQPLPDLAWAGPDTGDTGSPARRGDLAYDAAGAPGRADAVPDHLPADRGRPPADRGLPPGGGREDAGRTGGPAGGDPARAGRRPQECPGDGATALLPAVGDPRTPRRDRPRPRPRATPPAVYVSRHAAEPPR